MLTHEADPARGGGPLPAIKLELGDTLLRDTIFAPGRRITTWCRSAHFQLVSLKEIAEFLLLQSPRYKDLDELPMYVPGEILSMRLAFESPLTLYVSPNNPGARTFASELEHAYAQVNVVESLPDPFQSGSEVTHFLLYLNSETFLGDAGVRLAEEVRAVRAGQSARVPKSISALLLGKISFRSFKSAKGRSPLLRIILAHEKDLERGGCEFSLFKQTTPQDLINDRLYDALAFAAYPGTTHRAVSLALLARGLGAVPQRNRSAANANLSAETSPATLHASKAWLRLRNVVYLRARIRSAAQDRCSGNLEFAHLQLK